MHVKYLLLTIITVVSATSINDNTQPKGFKKQGFWGHCDCDKQLREVSCVEGTKNVRRGVTQLCDITSCRTCVEDDENCRDCKVYLNNNKFLDTSCKKYKFDIEDHNDREF